MARPSRFVVYYGLAHAGIMTGGVSTGLPRSRCRRKETAVAWRRSYDSADRLDRRRQAERHSQVWRLAPIDVPTRPWIEQAAPSILRPLIVGAVPVVLRAGCVRTTSLQGLPALNTTDAPPSVRPPEPNKFEELNALCRVERTATTG